MSAADVPLGRSTAAPAAVARPRVPAPPKISWLAPALMTTSSVASLPAAPTMAVYGLARVVPPGTRPTTVDSRVVRGEQLAIGIHCPEKLDEFTSFVNGLTFDDVQKN